MLLEYGQSENRGERNYMEDRCHTVIRSLPFSVPPPPSPPANLIRSSQSVVALGVFDGHAGFQVADVRIVLSALSECAIVPE